MENQQIDILNEINKNILLLLEKEKKITEPTIIVNEIKNYIKDFLNPKELPEPILSDDSEQLTFFPVSNIKMFEMYKKELGCFWTAEEIDLSIDVMQWSDPNKINNDIKFFIGHIIAFFAGSDGLINKNLEEHFINEVKDPMIKNTYIVQAMIEVIHGEVYSLILDTYIKDAHLKKTYFNAIKTIPCIKQKAEWALEWMSSKKSFSHRVVAFSIYEGVFFSGSFCAIYWLNTQGLLPGLQKANKFIARDEGMHTIRACLVYGECHNKLKESVVYEIIEKAVLIEKEFICHSLPCKLIGMNSDLMSQYIEYVADILLVNLGYEKKYTTTNPFPFMEKIGLQTITNFFEQRGDNYQKYDDNDTDLNYTIAEALGDMAHILD